MMSISRRTLSLRSAVFAVGYVLGPFTLWNDAFVNLPLTALVSEPLVAFFGFERVATYAVVYTGTNVLGLALMSAATATPLVMLARAIFKQDKNV